MLSCVNDVRPTVKSSSDVPIAAVLASCLRAMTCGLIWQAQKPSERVFTMKTKIVAAALLVLSPCVAQAVSVEGDRSLTLFGNGSSDDDFSTTTFGASGDLGYSVTGSRHRRCARTSIWPSSRMTPAGMAPRVCSITWNLSVLGQ